MTYELVIKAEFGAAHNLRRYKGRCERLHGHNWKLDIYLTRRKLGPDGMLIDFTQAKAIVQKVLDQFDHYYLNDRPPFHRLNPTSENIARVIACQIQKQLPRGVRVSRLTAWESDRCGATYTP